MDDKAFSDRVKKTFGSLFASLEPSPASSTKPLWSLTNAQVEKKEWRRDKDTSDRDSNPCSSSFNEFLSQSRHNSRKTIKKCREGLHDDLQDIDDDEDEGGDDEKDDIIDWDVKSSIGLDSTLDNEVILLFKFLYLGFLGCSVRFWNANFSVIDGFVNF